MITGEFWKLHDDAELRKIDGAALRLLTHTGCRIEHEEMLDAEMSKALQRFWGSFEVSEDTMALELIEQVIAGEETGFLETEHTLSHFRAAQPAVSPPESLADMGEQPGWWANLLSQVVPGPVPFSGRLTVLKPDSGYAVWRHRDREVAGAA